MRGMLFGERLQVANLERPLGCGTPVTSGVALVLGCGRKSKKNGLSSSKMLPYP